MLEALASSVDIDARHWPSILSTNSSVVAIKAGQLPGLLNALHNSGIEPQKWPVILKSGCAVTVVKDGNLLPVLKMLATTGIDSGHWHQILNNTTTTRSIIEKPSTFPTIMENLKRTTIAVKHYHRLLLTKHSTEALLRPGELQNMIDKLCRYGIDPTQVYQVLSCSSAAACMFGQPSTFDKVITQLEESGIDKEHWHKILAQDKPTKALIDGKMPTMLASLRLRGAKSKVWHTVIIQDTTALLKGK
jgi:hypothetical protein